MTNKDYPAIRAWGSIMGSFQAYIEQQVSIARAENAPALATYRETDDTWSTLANVTNPNTKDWFRKNHPELAEQAGFFINEEGQGK